MAAGDSVSVEFGNREVSLSDVLLLTAVAGPIGEQTGEADEIFLRFEKQTYSRSEVLQLVQCIARIRPDECDMSGEDLRLWWD